MKNLLRQTLRFAAHQPATRPLMIALHKIRNRHDAWEKSHPFDEFYGVSTNGHQPPWLALAHPGTNGYGGCQPSCLRQALDNLPAIDDLSFVDLGCGKGRALIIASEYAFQRIIGIELSPELSAIAQANVQTIHRRFPERTAIQVVTGDATKCGYPSGNLVVFFYHSFNEELILIMLQQLVAISKNYSIFLIYENPVHGRLMDGNVACTRWDTGTVLASREESLAAPANSDCYIIWHLGQRLPNTDPTPEANREQIVAGPNQAMLR